MNVDPRKLRKAFVTFLAGAGVDLATSPDAGLRALIDFYANVRADGCDPEADEDMLLFQWGTYDWGEGERFEIDLVRQVMVNEAIWQLHLTYPYPRRVSSLHLVREIDGAHHREKRMTSYGSF